MTRKRFVKQLMALGYQRNTAEALAIYARCGGWTYEQYLKVKRDYNGQLTALQTAAGRMAARFVEGMKRLASEVLEVESRVSEALKKFNFALPLTTSNRDGLVAAWSEVDEVSQWPKENPNLGAPKDEFQRKYMGRWVGIDLANGPDFTAGGGKA